MTRLALVLGVLPFLPPGRGALILMLGGLVVLPLSLLLSRIGAPAPKPQRAAAEVVAVPAPAARQGSGMPWQPVSPTAPHVRPEQGPRPWGGTGLERAIRQAVGATQLVAAEPGRYVVRLSRCDSCARRQRGCGAERAALERAVGDYLREPAVAEVACAQRGRRAACTFDIRGR